MGCPPPALPAYATTSSSSSFMSSSSSLSGSGNRVAPAYSSFPSSSSTSPYSSPPSYIDTLAPHHQHPHQRQHPLLSSSLTSSPYSSFTSPSSSSSSSFSSSSSTHYDRNNTPLSLSSSQLSLRHFSTAYMSGEVADEDKISAKLSSLASFEARPRSSRRRRKGFGFRNAGKSQEFDGCSSGEVTPLSSLTASFNSSPLSSQAVSDDEGDSSNNNNNDYDGFLMGGAADDLASSGEIPRVSSSSRKDKAATTPHQVAHTQGGPDRTRRDDLAASGESRTPCSSPAPRRAVSSSSLLDMPPSAGIG